jgi:hypothetical protein
LAFASVTFRDCRDSGSVWATHEENLDLTSTSTAAAQPPASASCNHGVAASVCGSVVDVRFDHRLPPIHTVLRAGAHGRIVIELHAQRDSHHARDTAPLPEVMGSRDVTLRTLIREYLFDSLFQACAESLASENASRLAAMERADRNIDELLQSLKGTFHRLRQSSIDEGLFDVVSGFEALTPPSQRPKEAR